MSSYLTAGLLVAALSGAALAGDTEIPAPGDLGGPVEGLSTQELRSWQRGFVLFDKNFHMADGVGTPDFNADSCRACHQDPVIGGAGGLELNVSRFGYDNGGAGPFQDLAGGQGLSKLRPPVDPERENYPPEADVFEQRQTPSTLGLGLLEQIPASAILANEDPEDSDGDGVYGVARMVVINGRRELGRFGWKAQVPKLSDFVRDAMANECGITTPDDGRGFSLESDGDAVADPELTLLEVQDSTNFLKFLAPPPRGGNGSDPSVIQGEALFMTIGCDTCHIPSLPSSSGPVRLYSDLLLHNVMPDGYRGMAEPGAPAGYFRTPPLWGAVSTKPYMHDGRAESFREAIQMHEGEASDASDAFDALMPAEQTALLDFLRDL